MPWDDRASLRAHVKSSKWRVKPEWERGQRWWISLPSLRESVCSLESGCTWGGRVHMYTPRPSLRLTKDFPDKWIFDTTLNSPALRRDRPDHWPSLMCLDHPSSQLPLGGWLDSEACKTSRCHLVKQNGCQFVGFCWAQTSVSPSSKTEALRASRLKTDGYCWI